METMKKYLESIKGSDIYLKTLHMAIRRHGDKLERDTVAKREMEILLKKGYTIINGKVQKTQSQSMNKYNFPNRILSRAQARKMVNRMSNDSFAQFVKKHNIPIHKKGSRGDQEFMLYDIQNAINNI